MGRYRDRELFEVLYGIDCHFDGDETETGQIWYTSSGHVFTIPKAIEGWFDADVIDRLLADRWLPKPIGQPKRYED